jgi:hypothetical protein
MPLQHKIAGLAAMAASVIFLGAFGFAAEAPADEAVMELLWADLEKPELEASRALLKLADRPKEAVAFLKEKMKPLKTRPGEVRALLLKLGSDKEEVWKAAFDELDYFDPRLAIDLETLMEKVTETPARQRMVAILSGYSLNFMDSPNFMEGKKIELSKAGRGSFNFRSEGRSWWAEPAVSHLNQPGGNERRKWTRAVRAIVLLEHIGTPDAVAVVKEMATGHAEAEPTRVAQETLKRLEKKPG